MKTQKRVDSQLIELAGRNWLMSQLQRAGIEVAKPERDRGVDLIAYIEHPRFLACPIQLKVSSKSAFVVYREKHQGMLLVYVWHVTDSAKTTALAMTWSEAEFIAKQMGWTEKPSYRKAKGYWRVPSVNSNSRKESVRKLRDLLERHKITNGEWMGIIQRAALSK
jgi:hypothetical protein